MLANFINNREAGFMKRKMKRFLSALLTATFVFGLIAATLADPVETKAAETAYGDSLTLNYNIKLNKTTSVTKNGVYQEEVLFKKKKTAKIKYTIKCSRKESGDNYKVTYKVTYKHLSDPKISSFDNIYDDYYWSLTQPDEFYTVFDYQTGLSLEADNDLGVKVKDGKWKYTYYPKQTLTAAGEKSWYRNNKTISYSFTVTYPKTCKDVVVGIGFTNHVAVPDPWTDDDGTVYYADDPDNTYWDGKVPYGKTTYYKKGKKTMSYMRLNK
jgi:hypothetical protein